MRLLDKLLYRFLPVRIIEKSIFFDKQWYQEKYQVSGNVYQHYLSEGWLKNYNPSDRFSSLDYLKNNPDIKDVNPLLHYEVFGKYEGRRPFIPPMDKRNDIKLEDVGIDYDEYFKIIADKDIVSFDLFDTLLIRPFVKEDDLFRYIEKKYDVKNFYSIRKDAETKARERLKKEVNIDEIYSYIDDEYRYLKDIEIDQEINILHINKMIKPLYDKAKELNKRVIIISDMYLPKEVISTIIEKNHYQIDQIYVSNSVNKTKGNGDLFEYVLNKENIDKSRIVHFGDNYLSDYSNARLLGIEAYQTPKYLDCFLNQNKTFLDYLERYDDLKSSICISLASKCDSNTYFEKIGYYFAGPLVLGYLNFICKSALQDKIDKLFFVSRDGYLLKDIYDRYFYNKYKIDSAYVYLSRAACIAGYVENKIYGSYTKLLEIMKFFVDDIDIYNNEDEDKKEYLRKQKEINEMSVRLSTNLKKHLLDNAGKSKTIATVDMVSARFTSYLTAKYYLNDLIVKGYFVATYVEPIDEISVFANRILGVRDSLSVKISEILISSNEKPIIALNDDGKPIYEDVKEDRTIRYQEILTGVIKYIDNYLKYFDIEDYCLINFDEWLGLINCYIKNCDENNLEELNNILCIENPVSSKDDTNFKVLIEKHRDEYQ